MNAHKKVFWWSLLFFIISLVGIIVFNILSLNFPYTSIYNIFLSVFASLIGGALISFVTSWVSFYQIKKQYEIQFISEVKSVKNILQQLVNWFNWHFKDINYELENSEKLQKPEAEEALAFLKTNNDKLVKDFIDIMLSFIDYDFNKIYYVLDDYCSLNLFSRNNKIRCNMYTIIEEINKYNILYDKNMSSTLELYEQKIYSSYPVYENIIQVINAKYADKSKIIADLNSLIKCYFCLTKVDKYTNKLTKKSKKDTTNE